MVRKVLSPHFVVRLGHLTNYFLCVDVFVIINVYLEFKGGGGGNGSIGEGDGEEIIGFILFD